MRLHIYEFSLIHESLRQGRTAARPEPLGTQNKRGWARHAVLIGLIVYLILHLGLGVAGEWSHWVRDPVYADKARKWRVLTAGAPGEAVQILFLGTSRTANGFAAAEAARRLRQTHAGEYVVFNWGVPASGAATQLVHLRRLLNEGQRVDILLWEFFPALAAQVPGEPVEARFSDPLAWDLSELPLLEQYGFPVSQWQQQRRQMWAAPWWALRLRLLGRVAPSWLPYHQRYDWSRGPDPHGWSPVLDVSQVEDKRPARVERARQEYQAVLRQWQLDLRTDRAIRDLLALARDHGIDTRLVWMPEGPSFQQNYSARSRRRIEQWLQRLIIEEGCVLVDCRTWMSEDDFVDGHHLLPQAAVRWTLRLTDEVLAPLLARPQR